MEKYGEESEVLRALGDFLHFWKNDVLNNKVVMR